MDDVLKSATTENETIDLAKDVKAVCGNGGFNLTKFVNNTECIINSIPDEHRAKISYPLREHKESFGASAESQ